MKKLKINMISKGQEVKGQGVGSAFFELVKLLQEYTSDELEVVVNEKDDGDINHYHTVDFTSYLRMKADSNLSVMYCHFLPETLEGSINLPKPAFDVFTMYFLDFYRSADYLVVVNPIFIDALVEYDIPRSKIKYIPNYVSKEDFFPVSQDQKNQTREKYGIHSDAFVILGVGQVQTRKGVMDFVEIAKRMRDVTFVWAGGFSFGVITDGYNELKAIVENPPSNVIFTDIIPREEMNDIFNMSDVLFMPSYNELFPMAILEAVNTDTPLLLRNLDLYKDILFEYVSGDNNEDFIYFINKLKDDSEFYEKASSYSRNIATFYSAENVSSQWVDFYHNIYESKANYEISLFWDSKSFEKLRSGKATMLVEGSMIEPKPLGELVVGDHLLITSSNRRKIRVLISDILFHENTDDEEHLDFLLTQQSQLKLDASQIKKYASSTYLQFLEITEVEDLSETK